MASNRLAKREKTLANMRQRQRATQNLVFSKLVMTVGALGIGAMDGYKDSSGKGLPTTLLRLPTKLWIAGGAYVGAAMTKGNLSRSLQSIGDSAAIVYQYKIARAQIAKESNVLVQGDEDYE